MSLIRVVIAHQKKATRAACLRILQSEKGIGIIGEVRSGLETIPAVARLKPHILILGFDLLREERIALLSVLRKKSLKTRVILLTRGRPRGKS